MHIETHSYAYYGTFGRIQVYKAPCVILTYSQPSHIPSPGIFKNRAIFKTQQIFDLPLLHWSEQFI